jgi:gas vesicle protein
MSEEQQNNPAGTILMVAAAFLGGIGLGILLAPKTGAETRAFLSDQSSKVAKQAKHLAEETADRAKHLAEETAGRAKHLAGETVDKARTFADNAVKSNLPLSDINSEAWRNVSRDLAKEIE